jgi:hypothetical protein
MPEPHIYINNSTGFQEWKPAIQIHMVPATKSQSSTQNVPETMHNCYDHRLPVTGYGLTLLTE